MQLSKLPWAVRMTMVVQALVISDLWKQKEPNGMVAVEAQEAPTCMTG
jgi:hypothetical protein